MGCAGLSHPYTGLIRLSPAGIDRVLEILGDADKKKAAAAARTERAGVPASESGSTR